MDPRGLSESIGRLAEPLGGRTGVVVWRPDHDEPLVADHADEPFALASVVKLPLMITLLRRSAEGAVDLDARVALRDDDRVPGSGVLHLLDEGAALSLRDLLRLAMVLSDNTATDLLFRLVPPRHVEDAMHALGYASLRVPHTIAQMLRSCAGLGVDATYAEVRARFADPAAPRPDDPDGASSVRGDRATPRDVARMLLDLHRGRLLAERERELAHTILSDCQTNGRIPALLPEGTKVAHKTGTLRGRTNDVGIVWTPAGPVVVALFQEGEPDEARAASALAQIARAIYDAVGDT